MVTNMVQLSGNALAFCMGISFVTGIIVGFQLKTWRVQYLKARRGYFANKLVQAQHKLDAATDRCATKIDRIATKAKSQVPMTM